MSQHPRITSMSIRSFYTVDSSTTLLPPDSDIDSNIDTGSDTESLRGLGSAVGTDIESQYTYYTHRSYGTTSSRTAHRICQCIPGILEIYAVICSCLVTMLATVYYKHPGLSTGWASIWLAVTAWLMCADLSLMICWKTVASLLELNCAYCERRPCVWQPIHLTMGIFGCAATNFGIFIMTYWA